MDGSVVDDRKISHTELRHFAHAFVFRYLKTKLVVEVGV